MFSESFNVINNELVKFIGTEVPIQTHISHLVTHAMGAATTVPKLHPTEIMIETQKMIKVLDAIKYLNPDRFDLDDLINQYRTIPDFFKDKDKLKKPVYLYIEFPDNYNTFIRVKLFDEREIDPNINYPIKMLPMLGQIGRKVATRLKLDLNKVYGVAYAHGALHCKIKFSNLPNSPYAPLSVRRLKYIIRDVERELLSCFNLDKELEWDY